MQFPLRISDRLSKQTNLLYFSLTSNLSPFPFKTFFLWVSLIISFVHHPLSQSLQRKDISNSNFSDKNWSNLGGTPFISCGMTSASVVIGYLEFTDRTQDVIHFMIKVFILYIFTLTKIIKPWFNFSCYY